MANRFHLSFSVGPVQSFVAQARRTRDLWAGSWLLSYLTESALASAERAGGEALIPFRKGENRGRILSLNSAVGAMPNRFEIVFANDTRGEQAIQAAHGAKQAFEQAWLKIANAVFSRCFDQTVIDSGRGTSEIWNRQINNFWQLNWVVGEPLHGQRTIGRLAAMRKNFRNVAATAEGGVKCALMSDYQELSGHWGKDAAQRQSDFWSRVRRRARLSDLELNENERLSAIALIKRVFPHTLDESLPPGFSEELHQVNWPSTAFFAAQPWLKSLSVDAQKIALQFRNAAIECGFGQSELVSAKKYGLPWASVDAPVWFSSALQHQNNYALKGLGEVGQDPAERSAQLRNLQALQKDLYRAAGRSEENSNSVNVAARGPTSFYSLLLMDGDSLGELLGNTRVGFGPSELSECLDAFSGQVEEVVEKFGGRLVYAGGDDVMALLPAEAAPSVAQNLRARYQSEFARRDLGSDTATISAAFIYAHWRFPLRQVIRTAHRLLDQVAKDTTGRDAILQAVVPGGGVNAIWSVPWDVYLGRFEIEKGVPGIPFLDLIQHFGNDEAEFEETPDFNSSFLYLLRERFGRLLGGGGERPGEYLVFKEIAPVVGNEITRDQGGTSQLLADLAHAEYRRRLGTSGRTQQAATDSKVMIDRLMSLSRKWSRSVERNGSERRVVIQCDPHTFSFDGWRIARFLKQLVDGTGGDSD